MPKLSIIILSFNTKEITRKCLDALISSLKKSSFLSQIIVVDNASTDGSTDMIKEFKKNNTLENVQISSIFNLQNEGYPKGNNRGIHNATGEYILFLNSDAIINKINWKKIFNYFDKHKKVGALTVRLELPSGQIDLASHRGFPTVWNSFCYFAKLEELANLFPFLKRFFGGYHLTHKDLRTIHGIDSPSGAFLLSPKKVINELVGFDETYFMYGEDLDLSYRMKELGYKIIYDPCHTVTHLKYQSSTHNRDIKRKTKEYYYNAMRIFYKKHYDDENNWFINQLVYFFINLKSRI
ncbi:glycosyl transferase family 2 [Candidatus Roizmanbacteria bacterium CG11_big_fil_rev_8_21_14_0_20_36_8]|uniref:Glycosyl transferase family 2 n=2 Tax=Candidatus Roizmaniibacteriota TaxID=1752723 RepID=A0A2M6IU68_9BACT|nr:MAG: glycosyl transferase family 2 [Candidatus Roizmanbacteria bacterium CG11_big_fil_rev_8_21_14_0_20_36_8]PIZ65370.1 MAG: glycosyl transferase family 2 [Candidatus Roizmanbacteria bacterium CG_4_10_14_0_2_um_filter_36_9]